MSEPDFEREARHVEHETVVPPNRGGGAARSFLIAGAFAAVALAAYFSIRGGINQPQAEKKPQEFRTTRQDTQVGFNTPKPDSDNNRLIIPPPPPPPPPPAPPPVAAPAAPIAPAPAPEPAVAVEPDHSAEDAAAAKLQAERDADDQRRLNSNVMVFGGGGGGNAGLGGGGSTIGGAGTGNGEPDAYREDDPNRRFASAIGAQDVVTAKATRNPRIDALIPQGTMIRGVLETAIQSDLPGMVRAKISQDIYSFDGRRVLLPRDTMLTGTYKSGMARGQTRILIIWQRALRADGTSISLGSYGTDDLGRSGLTGDIDKHYLERFGSAAVLSLVGGVSSFIAGLNVHGQSNTTNGNNSNNNNNYGQQAATQAQQSISQTMSDMANTALRDSINIPPTINVDQGTQIAVFVQRDLDFSSLYDTPEKELLDARRGKRYPTGRY